MEFNFALSRLALLAAFIAAFWLLGGFSSPVLPDDSIHHAGRVTKAWHYCVLLYLGGAISASVVDHFTGNLDRSNLRLAYILIGVALMAGSWLWQRHLRESTGDRNALHRLLPAPSAGRHVAVGPLLRPRESGVE